LSGQTSYSGFIGKFPITLVTDIYSDGVANATYVYDKFDEPIKINGNVRNNKLTLIEKDARKRTRAVLTFAAFDPKSPTLKGVWVNAKNGKKLNIALEKDFELEFGDGIEYANREIIQTDSLPGKYLMLVVSKTKEDFYARAVAVKIFEKRTDRLLQEIELDADQRGTESVSVGDFNFDNIKDFSVFESSGSGPNTSSLYFLYNPATNTYFDSGFEGTSLEFYPKSKQIIESNQCCAGQAETKVIYKVVRNKMVRIAEHCYIWNEKKNRRIKRPLKECQ
jgi:hypothetical protein